MAINWKNRNRLGVKIFGFGLGMYLVFSVLIYFVIYAGIPILYKNYKQTYFDRSVSFVIKNSKTIEELSFNITDLTRREPITVEYEYEGIRYNCLSYDECQRVSQNQAGNLNVEEREDYLTKTEKLDFKGSVLSIHFREAISSTGEIQSVLFLFLPIFGVISISMAFVLAYFISTRLSRSILKLRNDANDITALNFDIEQSVKSDDELGDLSQNLVVLASTLANALQELREANDKLYGDIEKERHKEEERRAYIATLSHDLKTPLTAIKGQLEGMLYNIGKYKDHETYLKNNIELANEMEEMIQSIIVSSKLDDYNMELIIEKMDLAEYIVNSLAKHEFLIMQKHLIIDNKLDYEYEVNVDHNLFSRAINNLVGNALEYADNETTISIEVTNNVLIISNVIENFNEELINQELIFKPFYRQDNARNKSGSGLGMYIVKKVCELHYIDIKMSYHDKTFSILLDLKKIIDVI